MMWELATEGEVLRQHSARLATIARSKCEVGAQMPPKQPDPMSPEAINAAIEQLHKDDAICVIFVELLDGCLARV